MNANVDLKVECKLNGNILVKLDDKTLYTCANARELVPYFERIGINSEDQSRLLTEAILCLERVLHQLLHNSTGDGESL